MILIQILAHRREADLMLKALRELEKDDDQQKESLFMRLWEKIKCLFKVTDYKKMYKNACIVSFELETEIAKLTKALSEAENNNSVVIQDLKLTVKELEKAPAGFRYRGLENRLWEIIYQLRESLRLEQEKVQELKTPMEGFSENQDKINELEKNNYAMKMHIADLTFALEECRKEEP